MTITEYAVCEGANINELETTVDGMMEEGFQPFGNLCVSVTDEQIWLLQPVVRYEET